MGCHLQMFFLSCISVCKVLQYRPLNFQFCDSPWTCTIKLFYCGNLWQEVIYDDKMIYLTIGGKAPVLLVNIRLRWKCSSLSVFNYHCKKALQHSARAFLSTVRLVEKQLLKNFFDKYLVDSSFFQHLLLSKTLCKTFIQINPQTSQIKRQPIN